MATVPQSTRDAWRRKSMRVQPVYPMAPVRQGARPEEHAAYLEARYVDAEYPALSRELGFFHPLTQALSEYRAVAQTLHADMEDCNRYDDEFPD